MENAGEGFDINGDPQSNDPKIPEDTTATYRRDLAFPRLTDAIVHRMRAYGHVETFTPNVVLYNHGDRQTDMFVILDGGIDLYLQTLNGDCKVFASLHKLDFSGDFNLLNSQGDVASDSNELSSGFGRRPSPPARSPESPVNVAEP